MNYLFRKKSVVIEAHQFDGSSTGCAEIRNWIENGEFKPAQLRTCDLGRTLVIETKEGAMTANPGDWIIKGVKGEFYPCKPDIFKATYEEVVDEAGS